MLPAVPKLLTLGLSYLPHNTLYIIFTKNNMETSCTVHIQLVPMGVRLLNSFPTLPGCLFEKGWRKHL